LLIFIDYANRAKHRIHKHFFQIGLGIFLSDVLGHLKVVRTIHHELQRD